VFVKEDGRLRHHAHRPADGRRVADFYAQAGLAPPSDDEAAASLGIEAAAFREITRELKRRGELAAPTPGLHFHARALDALAARVVEHFARTPELRPTDVKALFGLTRKHAMPLLAWLDMRGVTRRTGDARVRGHHSLGA
jgi:selenocysteine-specific elongation factor